MAAYEVLNVEIRDEDAKAGEKSINASLENIEKKAVKTQNTVTKSAEGVTTTLVSVTTKTGNGIERVLAGVQKKVDGLGLTGLQRLQAEFSATASRLKGDEAAIGKLTSLYQRLYAEQRKTDSASALTGAQSALASLVRDIGSGNLAGALQNGRAAVTGFVSSLSNLAPVTATGSSGLSSFTGVVSLAGGAVIALGAGVVAATGAAIGMISHYGDAAEATLNLANRLGLSAKATQELSIVADLAGVNVGVLEGAAQRLAANLEDAGPAGDKLRATLRTLGVSSRDLSGELRAPGAIAVDLFEKLEQVKNGTQRISLATDALGRASARELGPMIADWQRMQASIRAAGVTLEDNVLERLDAGADKVALLSKAWDNFKAKLTDTIAPVITPVIDFGTKVLTDKDFGDPFGGDLALLGLKSRLPKVATEAAKAATDAAASASSIGQGRRIAEEYHKLQAGTLETLRNQAAKLRVQLSEKELLIDPASGSGASAIAEAVGKAKGLRAQIASVDAQIKGFEATSEASKKAIADLAQSRSDFSKLIEDLGTKGLDPIASLIRNTITKLQEVVAKTGGRGLDSLQLAQANGLQLLSTPFGAVPLSLGGPLSGAFQRTRPKVEPVQIGFPEDPALTGTDFTLGNLTAAKSAALANSVAVASGQAAVDNLKKQQDLARDLIDFQTRRVELLAGPGGESAAVQQITNLRLSGLEEQKRLAGDIFDIDLERTRILQDAELKILQIQRDRFDDIKAQAGQVIDQLTRDVHNLGDALKSIFKAAILTPLRDFGSTAIATILTGKSQQSGGGSSGFGGLFGGLLSGNGGVFNSRTPGGTPTFSGGDAGGSAAGGSNPLGVASSLGGLLSSAGAATGGSGGILANLKAQAAGLKSNLTQLGNLGFKAGGKGVGGVGGGAMLLGGGILAADGLRRGGLIGLAETTGGGALIGAKFGGPVGAAIGAGIGFAAGSIRLLFDSADKKVQKEIKSVYGVDVTDKGIRKQILDIARSSYGGNLQMAVRSQQIAELVSLYKLTTTGVGGSTAFQPVPISLTQRGGTLFQEMAFQNGTGFVNSRVLPTLSSGQPPTIATTLQLDPETTRQVLDGRMTDAIESQPRLIAQSAANGQRSGAGLNLSMGNILEPQTVG